jgi:hypothetical protein
VERLPVGVERGAGPEPADVADQDDGVERRATLGGPGDEGAQ